MKINLNTSTIEKHQISFNNQVSSYFNIKKQFHIYKLITILGKT